MHSKGCRTSWFTHVELSSLKSRSLITSVILAFQKRSSPRDNISYERKIEIPYFSAGYRNICVHCGTASNLKPHSDLTFPPSMC